eukprot:3139916-Rhodomonas_salina.1
MRQQGYLAQPQIRRQAPTAQWYARIHVPYSLQMQPLFGQVGLRIPQPYPEYRSDIHAIESLSTRTRSSAEPWQSCLRAAPEQKE